MKYFSLTGSYEGGIKLNGRWTRAQNLNKIDKTGWERHQGPLTPAMAACLRESRLVDCATPFGKTVIQFNLNKLNKP